MKKIIIVGIVIFLIVSIVLAQEIISKTPIEQKVIDFMKADLKGNITVNSVSVSKGIIFLNTTIDNKIVYVITTDTTMNTKILSKNASAKLVPIKEDADEKAPK